MTRKKLKSTYNISEFLKIRGLVYKDFLGATIYAFMDR
jgi:hypothetical protein